MPPVDLLAAADPVALPGQWVDAGMSAWFTHVNRAELALARWMLESSRARAGTTERVADRPRSAKIVAASLGWSEAYAAQRTEFARQLLERLPALGDAMSDGRLEERKASLFTTTLADLDTDQAREVVERVLPDAPRLAFQALRRRIELNAEAVDPDWAAARRAAAIARRRVSFGIAPSGAADLVPSAGPAYGVALISRHPAVCPRNRGWPSRPGSARPGGTVTVATTHLSRAPGWNLVQLRRVVAALPGGDGPFVFLGDLNTGARAGWRAGSRRW